jgi:hypothetical protein
MRLVNHAFVGLLACCSIAPRRGDIYRTRATAGMGGSCGLGELALITPGLRSRRGGSAPAARWRVLPASAASDQPVRVVRDLVSLR